MGLEIGLWIVVFVLIFFSAVFSSSETALSTANRIRIKKRAQKGNKQAKRVLKLEKEYNRTLTGILIGNNVVNIAASSIGTILFTIYFGAAGAAISTVVLTILVLVFGEVMPKNLAKEHAEGIIMRLSGLLLFIVKLFAPFIYCFDKLKDVMEKFTKKVEEPSVTEQELKVIIKEIEDEGVLEEGESKLVRLALDFDDTLAERVMTPRVDIVSIDLKTDVEQIKSIFMQERFSRLPVYQDQVENIVGILYQKDFLAAYFENQQTDISALLHKAIFVPPQIKIAELLRRLQALKSHMAIVIDQYGGIEGLITITDIFERLVGEIYDEDDILVQDIQNISSSIFRVNADLELNQMLEKTHIAIELAQEDAHSTVGSWALARFGRLPKVGDYVVDDNIKITVLQMDGNRILLLQIQLLE